MAVVAKHNPQTPYLEQIQAGGIFHNTMIRVKGQMHISGTRFVINLQSGPNIHGPDDIPMHLSIRPDEDCIVRNHFESGYFGVEDRYGGCPIRPGQIFELLILAEDDYFKIAINGVHFCQFNYRLPLNRIHYHMIDGDVTLLFVSQECDTSSIQPIQPVVQPIVQPEIHHHHYVPPHIPQPPPIIVTNPHLGQINYLHNHSSGYYPQPPMVLGVRHPYPHGHHYRHHFRRRYF